MKIEGLSEEQTSALCEAFNLGQPIDVLAFLDRSDIPLNARRRVLDKSGFEDMSLTDHERKQRYREAQVQIIVEVAKLNTRAI
jgi:hypothetical protein